MTWWDNLKAAFDGRPAPRGPVVGESALVWKTNTAGGPVGSAESGTFPHFHSTAGDQFDTRGADRFAASRIKLRTAYTPAQPIIDRRMFAGRTRVLTQLIRSLEDERLHTVIYGERGLGKTSLLHVLTQAARDARYQVVYVTCSAGSTFDDVMRTVAENIPLLYHADHGPTSAEAERGDSFATLLGPDTVTVRGASDLLGKINGTRVLVVLDEFDRAESDLFRRSIAELVKSLSDRSVRVQFVIAGVAANFNELVANVPAIQRNISAFHVPKMSPVEVRELIKKGEPVTGIAFDDGAVEAIVTRSIGFPSLASLLSHRAGLNAIDRGSNTVTFDDVAAATSESVDDAHTRLSRRSQLDIAKRIASGALGALGVIAGAAQSAGGAFTVEDVNTLHADPADIAAARVLLDRLTANDVLVETIEDEFGKTYNFREFSMPVYLWLLAARDQTGARRAPIPVQADARS